MSNTTLGTRQVAWLRVKVAKKLTEAQDIASFELVRADGGILVPFSAGAHIDIYLPNGVVRPYSLCNAPGETHRYVIAVLKEAGSRGGSSTMHDVINEGDTVEISEPRNLFPLDPAAGRHLLLAGGIGITPILAMAQSLHAAGSRFELHYCGRSRPRMAFLERILSSDFAAHADVHIDDEPACDRFDLAGILAKQPPDTHLYVCGPQGYIDFVLATAKANDWADARLHYELFAPVAVQQEGDTEFQVKISSTGQVVTVPADETVLNALNQAGLSLPASCEQGVCGTCITGLLEGVPDHRDQYLTDEERAENKMFIPCCSRARSDVLVLDL